MPLVRSDWDWDLATHIKIKSFFKKIAHQELEFNAQGYQLVEVVLSVFPEFSVNKLPYRLSQIVS